MDPVIGIESRNMRHLLLLLLVVNPLSVRAATLSGTITDESTGVIPRAFVLIRWDPVGLDGVKNNPGTTEDKTATTDSSGHFSIDVPAGVYDIFVSAAGFAPHAEKITLNAKENHAYEFRLAVTRMTIIKLD
jgi:hypothetical protein